jgi:hypothetical protein
MSRLASMTALCSLLLGCQALKSSHPEPVRDLRAVSSVHTIYIAELREDDTSNLIERSDVVREAIREGLAQSGRFAITQDLSQADAVLTGLAGVERWYHGMEGYYGMEGDLDTHELGIGKLRLEDAKTKKVIWTHEYETGFLNPKQSVAERVAEQVTEKLVSDASHLDRGQPNPPQ